MANNYHKRLRFFTKYFGLKGVLFWLKQCITRTPKIVKTKVPVCQYPVYLRLLTSDFAVYRGVFIKKDYDIGIWLNPKLIIDAGANVGFSSIFFAQRYPEAQVVAIEPEDSNYVMLDRNCKEYANISPLRKALWKNSGTVNVVASDKGHWGFRTVQHEEQKDEAGKASEQKEGVPGMSVDDIMAWQNRDFVDILKIDIEGAEKEVFSDVNKWIQNVGIIFIELHEDKVPGCRSAFYHAISNKFEIIKQDKDKIIAKKLGWPSQPVP